MGVQYYLTRCQVRQASASRMLALIDNLLDLARGRGGGGLTLTRDANEALESALRTVVSERSASYPDRIVETNFALVDPVHCDRSRIAQLFSNILSNAMIYGLPDQPVRVNAVSGVGSFELPVANAGEPIPPEATERLFQPFYRNALVHDREGLGSDLISPTRLRQLMAGRLSSDPRKKKLASYSVCLNVMPAEVSGPLGLFLAILSIGVGVRFS
jgi:phosphoserine phosphatase RsbU/P